MNKDYNLLLEVIESVCRRSDDVEHRNVLTRVEMKVNRVDETC